MVVDHLHAMAVYTRVPRWHLNYSSSIARAGRSALGARCAAALRLSLRSFSLFRFLSVRARIVNEHSCRCGRWRTVSRSSKVGASPARALQNFSTLQICFSRA
ncbi:putative IS element transposase [Trichinella spiralis]|uniref:putative IS element transposase n=1 Tax=Trichinella spiralis TaxID=6334 RepID=UPI0001EFB2CA|nr:putative IS element transposase [Trichinella spiralis]